MAQDSGRDGFWRVLFDPRGRVGRAGFFVGLVVVAVLWRGAPSVLWPFVRMMVEMLSPILPDGVRAAETLRDWAMWGVRAAAGAAALYCAAVLVIRRLHDCDWRGGWAWAVFAPLAFVPLGGGGEWAVVWMMVALVLLMLVPSRGIEDGWLNRFGERRKTSRGEAWAAWVLGILVVVMVGGVYGWLLLMFLLLLRFWIWVQFCLPWPPFPWEV